MKIQNCLTLLLCLFLKTDAQEIKPLTVGDKIPVSVIKIFPAFSNKLVILDFMATTCSGCIKALPEFSALQKKYNEQLQIIAVTTESNERVKKFLLKHAITLPLITGDTVLSKLFPHTFIPHEVWIKNGVVKAITKSDYVSDKNVSEVLNNEDINWPVKTDMRYDYSKALFTGEEPLFYSMITRNIKEASARYMLERIPRENA